MEATVDTPFLKSEPLVQPLRGLFWAGFNHASVVAQHEDYQTRAVKCESLRCRTRGTFLSVFSEVLFTAQNKQKKKVIETIKHDQHCVVSCHSMCLQKLFLIVILMKVASDGLKEKCIIAQASNCSLGFVDIHTLWTEMNETKPQAKES